MKILVTNDDGINAPGLSVLENIANIIAGSDGEVWIVAPSSEQSGVAHCISFTKPMQISKISERKFSVDGSPADCVLAGIYDVMRSNKPDLILSGVNRGNNSTDNSLYSGTIGAAIEGTIHKIKSIALSQYLGPRNIKNKDPFEAANYYGAEIIEKLLEYNEPLDIVIATGKAHSVKDLCKEVFEFWISILGQFLIILIHFRG